MKKFVHPVQTKSINQEKETNDENDLLFNHKINKSKNIKEQNNEKLQLENEISELKNEYEILLIEDEKLDQELDLMKEKFLQESTHIKNVIEKNQDAIKSLQITAKSIINDTPIEQDKSLQVEIDRLKFEISALKDNEYNINFSQQIIQKDTEELEFLIDAVPFQHESIYKLAEQKITHQINKDIIEHQLSVTEASSEKESLEIEVRMISSVIDKWTKENQSISQKIKKLEDKRKQMVDEYQAINQNKLQISTSHTIPSSELQKKIKNKELDTQKELEKIDDEYKKKFRDIETNNKITQAEINERMRIIEELNMKHNELVAKYENMKSEHSDFVNRLKTKQTNELNDIKYRFNREREKNNS